MFSLNSLNSVRKIFVITVKGFEPATSCARDPDAYHSISKTHVETRSLIEPNSCFSDFQIP